MEDKDLGACQASPATALSPSGSSPSVSPAAPLQSHGARFTPGPWEAVFNGAHPSVKDLRWVEIAPPLGWPITREYMSEANARLIAAAPDLYEALAELVRVARAYEDRLRKYGYEAGAAGLSCAAENAEAALSKAVQP